MFLENSFSCQRSSNGTHKLQLNGVTFLSLSPEFEVVSSVPEDHWWHALKCGLFQVLAQAIKAAKEQHPDMSVTKVVVHQETEIAEE